MTWLAVAIGGALGSIARHAVSHAMPPVSPFPMAITLVNISGCLVIGLLAGLIAAERIVMSTVGREFVFVGLLGGFTTFSTFGLDTFVLLRSGAVGTALLTIASQVLGGLVAVCAGYRVGTARI